MFEGYGYKIPNFDQNITNVVEGLIENGLFEGMDFDIDEERQELTYYNDSHVRIVKETVRKHCLL